MQKCRTPKEKLRHNPHAQGAIAQAALEFQRWIRVGLMDVCYRDCVSLADVRQALRISPQQMCRWRRGDSIPSFESHALVGALVGGALRIDADTLELRTPTREEIESDERQRTIAAARNRYKGA